MCVEKKYNLLEQCSDECLHIHALEILVRLSRADEEDWLARDICHTDGGTNFEGHKNRTIREKENMSKKNHSLLLVKLCHHLLREFVCNPPLSSIVSNLVSTMASMSRGTAASDMSARQRLNSDT